MSYQLTEVRDIAASHKTIYLDGHFFIDCGFTGCTLVYSGGDWGRHNTIFMNCDIVLAGAALRSMEFLHLFNYIDRDDKGVMKQLPKPVHQ